MVKATSQPAKDTKLPDGTVTLTLKVTKDEVAKAYQKVLNDSAQTAEIKGFRKGHAPLNLVESSLDKSKLYSRVLDYVLPPAYSKELKEGKYLPLLDPRITPLKMEEGKDWEFKAEIAVEPEVRVGEYKKYIKTALNKAKKARTAQKDKKLDDKKEDNWQLQTVFDAILANAQVTPSELLVEHEAHAALHRLENQLSPLKLKLDDYLKSIKKDPKEFHAKYHDTARNNLRLEFALKSIIEMEKPEISENELSAAQPTKDNESYVRYLLQKKKVLDIFVKL